MSFGISLDRGDGQPARQCHGLIGVPLLAVLFLHATTFEVGALAAVTYLPWLIIGLPAGAWVDRLPPRPVMIACDVASAVLYASVPVAYASGVLTIGQLLAVQLLTGAARVLFFTASSTRPEFNEWNPLPVRGGRGFHSLN
jgi:MFS family permease